MPTHPKEWSHVAAPKFKSPEEELEYLRERVKEKERELESPPNRFESDRIAKREVVEYSETPAAVILHEEFVLPEHETLRHFLKLEPETHDKQIDGLMQVVVEHGIRNALSVVSRLKNPHIEDDFHRILVRYIAEGLPDKGMAPPEKVRRALHQVVFEVHPQAHGESEPQQGQQQKLEQLLSSSEQLYAGLISLVGHEGFSLEIAVADGTESATLYLAVPRSKQTLAERLISSVFPNARIDEARGDFNIFNAEGEHAAAYATLAGPTALPLKTFESFEHDPLNVILAAFAKIAKHGEGAAIQFVVSSEGDRYNRHFKKMLREIEKGKSLKEATRVPETMLGEAMRDLGKMIFSPSDHEKDKHGSSGKPVDQVSSESISRKIKSRVVPVTIRLVASAPNQARADDLLNNLIAPFSQYDDPKGNHLKFKHVSNWSLLGFLRDFTYRAIDPAIALPLSLVEIATMFHFTAERVTTSRELKRAFAKQAPAPVDMPADGIVMGINKYGATESEVRFGESDRLRHCYIIGQTGTGKSGLVKNMIMQDIKNGEGVCFIDPHGNDIEDVLASVPPERAGDVVYFDPAYTERVMGLNMLEYDRSRPDLKAFVVDELYGVFRKLYSDVPDAFGPMFEQYYRNATQLVIEDPDTGSTMVEVPRVLSDSSFRNLKLSRCQNPIIVQFWRKIAEAAGGEASLENVVPYITSKFDVFLSNDIMRPIVAQEHSAFDFRDIMDNRKIFLANMSKGRLGDRNSSLLGLIIVSKFLQAAFSRADSRGTDLPPFYLYIDEFQNFATPSIATILSEARKYKLSLIVAHQFIAQLDDEIREAVVGNVGTRVAFRVGNDDSEPLAKQFAPVFTSTDLEHLPFRNAVMGMLVNGVPSRPFTIETTKLPHFENTRIDAMKELSYRTFGRPRAEVEAEVKRKFTPSAVLPPQPRPFY